MHRAELLGLSIQISGPLRTESFFFFEDLPVKLQYIMVNVDERASRIFTKPQGVFSPFTSIWDLHRNSSKEKTKAVKALCSLKTLAVDSRK